jgi:hypothetical protein
MEGGQGKEGETLIQHQKRIVGLVLTHRVKQTQKANTADSRKQRTAESREQAPKSRQQSTNRKGRRGEGVG